MTDAVAPTDVAARPPSGTPPPLMAAVGGAGFAMLLATISGGSGTPAAGAAPAGGVAVGSEPSACGALPLAAVEGRRDQLVAGSQAGLLQTPNAVQAPVGVEGPAPVEPPASGLPAPVVRAAAGPGRGARAGPGPEDGGEHDGDGAVIDAAGLLPVPQGVQQILPAPVGPVAATPGRLTAAAEGIGADAMPSGGGAGDRRAISTGAPSGMVGAQQARPGMTREEPASGLRAGGPPGAAAMAAEAGAGQARHAQTAPQPAVASQVDLPTASGAASPQAAALPPDLAPTTPFQAGAPLPSPLPSPLPPLAPAPASPVAQMGAAFVALGAPQQAGDAQPVLIRLAPAELGQVQISIDRPAAGGAHVVLAVERSDTMMLLMRDRPHLDRALDAAGVPAAGRMVEFTLAPAVAAPVWQGGSQSGAPPDGMGTGYSGGGGQAAMGGEPGGAQQGPEHRGGFSGQGAEQQARRRSAPALAWLRAGVDITA